MSEKSNGVKAATKRWWQRFVELVRRPMGIAKACALMSLFTLVAYNIPAIVAVYENVGNDFNGWLLFGSVLVLLLVVNFLVYYLLLFLGRAVGKGIIAFTFIGNAIALYFVNGYNVILSQQMMGNVFNTRNSEASGFFSFAFILYVLLLGILPTVLLFMFRIDYKRIGRFFATFFSSLAVIVAVLLANIDNVLWIDRNATQLGGLLMPYSYTVNSALYYRDWKLMNRSEIILPDAKMTDDSKDVCVLVIGESARKANFSLYGYERNTNPLLAGDSVKIYNAVSADTYTTAGVKAILDYKASEELNEILPNYLHRNGVNVVWRSNNWGESKLKVDTFIKASQIKALYPEKNIDHDDILLEGLRDDIVNSKSNKMLVVLHTSTSHGPTYFKKYPEQFETFTPVCREVEMSKADLSELVNAYDNTIVYTDYMLHSIIEVLRSLPEWRSCMMYVSDHGESLGEGGMYMHGVPMMMAPAVQYEIPFIVWDSDQNTGYKDLKKVEQYNVFHSVMSFLGLESPIRDENRNIFLREQPASKD